MPARKPGTESAMDLLTEARPWEEAPARFSDPIVDDSIYNFEEHIKEDFIELFEEAPTYQDNSIGRVLATKVFKGFYKTMFVYTTAGVYYFFVIVVGFFMTLIWSLVFGVSHFALVWFAQPGVKLFFTWMRIYAMYLRAIVRIILDPVYHSIGQMYVSIRGRFKLNVSAPYKPSELPKREVPAVNRL